MLLAVLVALVAGAAACGSGSGNASSDMPVSGARSSTTTTASSPGSASPSVNPSSSSPSGSTSSAAPGSAAWLQAQLLRFAQCMRAQGISDFPDPSVGANGQPVPGTLPAPTTQVQAATKACHQYSPAANLNPSEEAAAKAKALEYAACMRSHGEPDFPDPDGTGLIQITNPTGILAPTAPQYVKAQQACQSLDSGFTVQTGATGSGS